MEMDKEQDNLTKDPADGKAESKEDKPEDGKSSQQKHKSVASMLQASSEGEQEISQEQVFQLLRDMELVDNEGDCIWEDGHGEEVEDPSLHMGEEENEQRENLEEFHLPEEITPSFQEFQTQYGNFSGCSTQKTEAEDSRVDDLNKEERKEDAGQGFESTLEEKLEGVQPKPKKKKREVKWGPVVPERKSSRLLDDNRTAKEKAAAIKKARNLEDNYVTKGLAICESGDKEAMEMPCCLETNVQGGDGRGNQQMVQLLGGSAFDPISNWRLKKLKSTGGGNNKW
ncbi:unnamed protein product [Urochloa humidicola]